LLNRLGQRSEAEAAHRRALALREKLAVDFPAVPSYRGDLAGSYSHLGVLLHDLGRRTEAETAYRHALAIEEKLAADFPAAPDYRLSLAETYVDLANLLRNRGEAAAALDWYAKAIALLEAALAQDSRLASARLALRAARRNRAEALRRLARPVEAVQEFDRALALNEGSPTSGDIRLGRAKALFAQTGDPTPAIAVAEELIRGDRVPGHVLFSAAGVYALASTALNDDAPRNEAHAAQAVALLRRAHVSGYFNGGVHVEEIRTDTDFATLRDRGDFQALVKELETKK
jgi:tetratricopeptide (TPR) repeat protein